MINDTVLDMVLEHHRYSVNGRYVYHYCSSFSSLDPLDFGGRGGSENLATLI